MRIVVFGIILPVILASVGTAHAQDAGLRFPGPVVQSASSSTGMAKLGEACGGKLKVLCAANLFCDIEDPKCDGSVTGRCVALQPVCSPNVEPVCGCDGKLYANDCYRQIALVNKANPKQCRTTCEKAWDEYDGMYHLGRFFLGGLKMKAEGEYGNSSGDKLDGDAVSQLLTKETKGSVDFGYFEKSILRDARFLVADEDAFKAYCEAGENSASRILFWDAFKLDLQGGYGTTLTNEQGTTQKFETEEKWRYSVGLTYEVPFEGLVRGLGILDKK